MPLGQGQRTIGHPDRQAVVAREAPHLLDDVLGDRDVGAHSRWGGDERVAIGGRRELKPAEDIEGLGRIDVDPHHAGHVGEAHAHVHSAAGVRVAIHDAFDLRAGMLAKQLTRSRERDGNEVRRELPGESPGRCAARRASHIQLRRGPTDAARIKRRRLECHGRRVGADLRILATDDPRDAERTLGVRDHERSLGKQAVDPIERA